MNIIDELLDRREVHELIDEIRDELKERRLYREEYFSKMDDLIYCLNKISEQDKEEP
jgi:predicted RNA-binding protein with EMAP domain